MWPQNSLFFLVPSIVIILVFFLLPFIARKKEPFGYKTDTPLSEEDFKRIRNVYHRKVFLFSVPLTAALSIMNMYILSTLLGSALLGILILGLAGINFMFYMQAYRQVRSTLETYTLHEDEAAETAVPEDELPKW